ncbi:MAG: tRNA glutamyl-Q(34) synthetase GluQRS [Alphaproteobacteria bacterium]|nr:tRNA glutamyl-Q(34) synthetase GluQRS [Alphaproteobacteria bacterium]
MIVTRFAPSPTGRLHLGHAASALFAFNKAREAGGTFLLRIEDIDPLRCKSEYIEGIYEDLHWLGLNWPEPVRFQSRHLDDYKRALAALEAKGLLYPCFCTRKEIVEESARAGRAPHEGEDAVVYPGTCRSLSLDARAELAHIRMPVWRLDMEKAVRITGQLFWRDELAGQDVEAKPERFGDIVLARKEVLTSYHLSVTVDDALQGVTLVTRGEDLRGVTDIHRLLQALLDLPVPRYAHHPLLYDGAGKKFSKRDQSVTLASLRQQGGLARDFATIAFFPNEGMK